MTTLNTEIVKTMNQGFDLRTSVAKIAEQVGDEPEDVLDQLQMLIFYGFALRWSDGRFSLSTSGDKLKQVLTRPVPRSNGRPPV